jgi:hypothetical protein
VKAHRNRAEAGLTVILLLKRVFRIVALWLVLPVIAVASILNWDRPDLLIQIIGAVMGMAMFYGCIVAMERLFRHLAA